MTNKLNPALGFISDNKANQNNKLKIVNKEFKLSFEVPEKWTENAKAEKENESIEYDFAGGGLFIYKGDESKDTIAANFQSNLSNDSTIKITSTLDTTIGGLSAKKFTYTRTENSKAANVVVYVFGDNTKHYMAIYIINEAFATAVNVARIEDAIASIQVTP